MVFIARGAPLPWLADRPHKEKPPGFTWGFWFPLELEDSLFGQGCCTAEGCTDDGDDGKDFHGWEEVELN